MFVNVREMLDEGVTDTFKPFDKAPGDCTEFFCKMHYVDS